MLTGDLPFEAPNAPTLLVKHLSEPVPHVRDRAPHVPAELDELIHSMMAKSPADRPVDAQAVQVRLTRIAAELGIAVPTEPELESPPASRQIRPGEAQLWERRTKLFDSMLRKAFAAGAPPDMERMLADLRAKVAEVAELRASAFEEQQKLEIIESEGREGRLRFGQAMDTLSLDASRMREEARALRQGQAPLAEAGAQFAARLREAHRDAVTWEGRCAFVEPHAELARAYRGLADILDQWLDARRKEQEAERSAADLEAQLVDLDYQIKELRSGLENLNHDVDDRRVESQRRIADMGRRADQLEGELLHVATRFTAPLRAKPELVPLFRELETAS
jgi:serine/threonine-protein kinase